LALLLAWAGTATHQLIERAEQVQTLKQQNEQLNNQKEQETKKLQEDLEKTRMELESTKQAKTQQKASLASTLGVQTAYAAPSDDPKMFIYLKESGNDPTRWNDSGCLGLGQACPASKLLVVCPNMDYACEDAWFTQYAINRYGSWQGAYNFWIVNHWW
jgi:hypothetical protein